MTRRSLLAIVAPLLGFTLACGTGSPPSVPAPVAPPLATDPVGAGPTGGLSAIAATGRALRVAADADAAPFLVRTAAGFEGFEYAIAEAVAQGAGLKVEIVPASFSELPGLVTSGRADLAIGQLSPSSAYDGLAWSVSYLQYSLCLITPSSSAISKMADLKGKRVGMYDDPVARQLASVLVGATYEPVIYEDYGYFEKMVRGQLDAMVYDCPLARFEMKMYGDLLHVADDALNIATYNVAVRKDDERLLRDVNAALKSLGEQGLLATLEQRWLGEVARAGAYETAAGKVIVVGKGESLSTIAGRELGAVDRWKALYDANKDVVGPDPDVVYAGMRLRVPK